MSRTTTTQITTETALFARDLMAKLGMDESMVVGNAATGESTPLPPAIANLVRQVLRSLAAGRDVTIAENLTEVTPNEAADILNVSRTFVIKLMDEGQLPFRMVGSHRRIPYPDLMAYRDAQDIRSRKAMDDLYALERESGLDAIEGPAPDKSTYRGSGSR